MMRLLPQRWRRRIEASAERLAETARQKQAMATLDCLIARYGTPAFCKIDVEGFEAPVLKGLSNPIPVISFEFTREFFSDAKTCIDHLLWGDIYAKML